MAQNFNINISNAINWVKNKVKLIDAAKPVCKNHFQIQRAAKYVDLYKTLDKKILMNPKGYYMGQSIQVWTK